jgi:hypothetical protein
LFIALRSSINAEVGAPKSVWHSFRHSLATNLRSLGVDIKVAQELMRHSRCRTTLDVYTRAAGQQKREASLRVVGWMLPLDLQKSKHRSAPLMELEAATLVPVTA